jgi:hypothetical protein
LYLLLKLKIHCAKIQLFSLLFNKKFGYLQLIISTGRTPRTAPHARTATAGGLSPQDHQPPAAKQPAARRTAGGAQAAARKCQN